MPPPQPRNLAADTPPAPGSETFATLLEQPGVRIVRIVSRNHASPEGFWYEQPEDEWVLVFRGQAVLEFPETPPVPMKAGDHLFIPRRTRHRVAQTSEEVIWLAVHLAAD